MRLTILYLNKYLSINTISTIVVINIIFSEAKHYYFINSFLGYLIIDSNSKKMICIDPGDYAIARYNIEMLEMKHKV